MAIKQYKNRSVMKRPLSLLKHAAAAAMLLFVALGTASCEKDVEGSYFVTEYFTVEAADWIWNDLYQRYEYAFPYNRIDNYVYEQSPVTTGVYVMEDGFDDRGRPVRYEVLKPMPFVQSYMESPTVKYTETISFDISPGWITFFVQASDLSDADQYLATYDFKVSVFYETRNTYLAIKNN